jgi:hypothetical protein
MLMTFLGPVKLWRLSTTPGDAALRRFARVFPHGSAVAEID